MELVDYGLTVLVDYGIGVYYGIVAIGEWKEASEVLGEEIDVIVESKSTREVVGSGERKKKLDKRRGKEKEAPLKERKGNVNK